MTMLNAPTTLKLKSDGKIGEMLVLLEIGMEIVISRVRKLPVSPDLTVCDSL